MSRSLFSGHDNLLIFYIALVTFTKVFATSATNGSGGCGGTFAPSLFIGGFAGFLFARLWNMLSGRRLCAGAELCAMGMAGLITGVMHAPADGHLPHRRTHGRLSALHAADDCVHLFLAHHQHLRESQHLCPATGKGGQVAHPPCGPFALTLMSMQSMVEKDYHPSVPICR